MDPELAIRILESIGRIIGEDAPIGKTILDMKEENIRLRAELAAIRSGNEQSVGDHPNCPICNCRKFHRAESGWCCPECELAAIRERAEDVEMHGRIMHESWMRTRRAQGFHHPAKAHPYNPHLYPHLYSSPPYRCEKCHPDLIPWEQLPEAQKDINRHAFDDVRAYLLGGKK